MLWSVGNRFKFSDAEIQGMTVSRLRFWYRGHQAIDKEEQEAQEAALAATVGGGHGA